MGSNQNNKRAHDRHLNWMGGGSFSLDDPLHTLRLAASSCFFGEPMYYHRDPSDARPRHSTGHRAHLSDERLAHLRATLQAVDPQDWRGLKPAELMERVIDEALGADPEATLREAIRLRQQEHMRMTPQVILVRAANHEAVRGTGLVRKLAPEIIARADEPATGLTYQLAAFGKPVPNQLKKAWRDALERFDDYQLAKYRMENRQVKTVDVVNLTHPSSASIDRLMRDELRMSGQSWEAILSEEGSNEDSWRKALGVMGHMALLRNLRNLLQAGLQPRELLGRLIEGAESGRQLPFRYYSAYSALTQAGFEQRALRDGLELCMLRSMKRLPHFAGRTMSLCDNSGSACGTTTSSMGSMQVRTIANLSALLTSMRSDDGEVGVFGDRLERRAIQKEGSIFGQLDQLERLGDGVGGGTENGVWLFFDQAIREREHWDRIFIYSDMQAGHGGLYGTDAQQYREYIFPGSGNYIDVASLVAHYRKEINPEVMVFMVQVAGYQDSLVPEFYERSYILGGWGPGLLRFADAMSRAYDGEL